MTRSDILRLVGGALWLLAFSLIAAEKRILRRLRRHGATDAGSAAPLSVSSPLIRWRLDRLLRSGAVVRTTPDHFYLDSEGFARYRRRRRRRAMAVLSVVLPLVVLIWWINTR